MPLRTTDTLRPPPGLAAHLGDQPCRCLVRTASRVDTGYWGRRPRLWLALTDHQLTLFAHGKAPYLRQWPADTLAASFYNHVTGQLVVADAHERPLHTVSIPPQTARPILDRLRRN